MKSNSEQIAAMKKICKQRGQESMKKARQNMLLQPKNESTLAKALQYFSKVTLRKALPVFPALVSLSCEGAGGNPEIATSIGEAIVLITGAADLHDDVIDQSFSKGTKQTVLGKFGVNITILAGDTLLVQGLRQLHEASQAVTEKQSKDIMFLTAGAVSEICSAEVLEVQLRGRLDLTPEEYYEVIRLKAVVPELTMKLGAILADAESNDFEKLGQFGRTYGIISTITDEFADLLDSKELRNRLKNECPPLPIIYALQDSETKTALVPLLNEYRLNENVHEKIVKTVLTSREVQLLRSTLVSSANLQLNNLPKMIKWKIREELETLLLAPLACLDIIFS